MDVDTDEAVADKDDHRSLAELGDDHAGMIARMEDELVSIEGLVGKEAEKRKGRAEGPKYVWRHVAGEAGDSSQNTTSVSRAWRRTATWMTTIMKTKNESTAQAARWKVLNYAHPSPDNARASKEQLEAMKEFASWKQAMDHRQLYNKHWLTMLRDVALKQAERQEAEAQGKALTAWKDYLSDGPAKGLRRQHQFTKTATGWTETEIARASQIQSGSMMN